ncbi:uncharacterized protein PHALS_09689 [Plasmopara halstedii]|uniref:Uncharacterized protein n=1 Tax=Plasmopara halstedii TaxID=4781 RepID=A0A0N7L4R9_PLAHL|nr:uncharacterized protein PHALS_09689 [Plasmopara halstedii]CEG39443.1 hypothetical protein PHALS_09689 [Plasmopara halstedii]|eukprot:XP_024575812.1 hypothetical protein PHALS_09689 [Plasmopara halstedii]
MATIIASEINICAIAAEWILATSVAATLFKPTLRTASLTRRLLERLAGTLSGA